MRTAWAIVGVLLAAACSSSGSGSGAATDGGTVLTGPPGEAGTPCDAAGAGRDCSLSMPVSGGLTGTLDGETGCGEGSGTGGTLTWTSSALGGHVTATFTGAVPMSTGTYTLASLQVRSTDSGGAQESWTSPSGACSITVTSVDVECQVAFRQWLQIVNGTGSCRQPLAPDTGTTAPAVMVGSFQFSHWL